MKISQYWKIISLTILLSLSIIFCFTNLKSQKLERWDEYTNFSVVYDTIESDDELILTQNGEPFFEKPPLWYYLSIASTELFGLNLFALRFVSALSGVLLIMFIWYMGYKMFSFTSGIVAGFSLLATSHLFIPNPAGVFSSHTLRSADLDALQLLFIMISAFSFYMILSQPKKWLFWTSISSIYTSLAFLTKGPFALLPPLLFFSYIAIQQVLDKKDKALNNCQWKNIVIIFITFLGQSLLITAPWHIAMYIRFKDEFVSSYFGYHMLIRGFTTIEEHYGRFYYYIRILLDPRFGFLGIATIISSIIIIKNFGMKILHSYPLYMTLGGLSICFLIISIIQTKLAWYVFYLYPLGALLVGNTIHHILKYSSSIKSRILIFSPLILYLLFHIAIILLYLCKL